MRNEDDVLPLCKFVDRPLFSSKFNCGRAREACFCDNLCMNWELFPDETYFILFICITSFIFFALYHINIECLSFIIYEVHWNILFLFSFLFILHIHILIIFMLHSHDKLKKVCITNSIWHTFVAMQIAFHTSGI